jgi:hypothetical protein
MASTSLKSLLLFVTILVTASGCMGGYGYGVRPGYYGSGYGYRAPVYRGNGGGWGGGMRGGGWGYSGGSGGFRGGGCRH